jgi:hypothetical protein
MDRARSFASEPSPMEQLYGGGEVAAAIAAGMVAAEG